MNNKSVYQDIGVVDFIVDHVYPAPGTYVVSYIEPNLAPGVINVLNSGETRMYLESSIKLNSTGFSFSPHFPTFPIMQCTIGQQYSFSTAVIDDTPGNEFYYQYSLIQPKKEKGHLVSGYTLPENLLINKNNGMITWDTKFKGDYVQGVCLISVRIDMYDKAQSHRGYVERLVGITVEDGESEIAIFSSPGAVDNKVSVAEGQKKKIKVILSGGAENFTLYFSETLKENVGFTQYDSLNDDQAFKVAFVTLTTTTGILSDLPYPITLRGNKSLTFRQADITFLYFTRDIEFPPPPPPVVGFEDEVEVSVYPNPFQSELYIGGTMSTQAVLLNSAGQVLINTSVHPGQPINTSALGVGYYVLQIVGKDETIRSVSLIRE